MLGDFFRINMPYGVRGNKQKGWFTFNREYKPLGFNKYKEYVYEDYPIYTKYKGLNQKLIDKLTHKDNSAIRIEKDDTIIYLYNDGTNPMNKKRGSNNWSAYFQKIQLLSSLKRDITNNKV